MKGICPNCEEMRKLELIKSIEEIVVRGEPINVEVEYLRCTVCGSKFNDPESDRDPLEDAYRIYRLQHGMLQPEKIKELREQYGLNQQELSAILGWGGATLSRYENGALQDDAHETILRLIQEPHNLLELVEQKPEVLSEKKRERLLALLDEIISTQEKPIAILLQNRFGTYEPNELSGYRLLDITKLFNALIFFCKGDRVPKTKLNKLAWYADFLHFNRYTVSITGCQYAHLPYGPAPDHYEFYLAALQDEEKAVSVEEVSFPEYIGEYLIAIREPDLSLFSTSELKILTMVKEFFADFNAKKISEQSHQEKGYQETKNGDLISYEYAKYLTVMTE